MRCAYCEEEAFANVEPSLRLTNRLADFSVNVCRSHLEGVLHAPGLFSYVLDFRIVYFPDPEKTPVVEKEKAVPLSPVELQAAIDRIWERIMRFSKEITEDFFQEQGQFLTEQDGIALARGLSERLTSLFKRKPDEPPGS